MVWPDALSEGFPEFRDDEPSGLRGNIVDELVDHLDCALTRQQQVTDDETQAWLAVVERFGEPKEVARKLWFYGMKERIMRERITLVLMGLAVAACFAAIGLAWMAFQEIRESNQTLLAKLNGLKVKAVESKGPSEWTELSVGLIKGRKGGGPAEGFTVGLSGNAINPSERVELSEVADQQGLATFSPIRPGKFHLYVQSPWGHEYYRELVLLPGGPHFEEIVCPAGKPSMADVSFAVEWPDELQDRKLLLHGAFGPEGDAIEVDGYKWMVSTEFVVTLKSDGQILSDYSSLPRVRRIFRPPEQGISLFQLDTRLPYAESDVTIQARLRSEARPYQLYWYTVLALAKNSGPDAKQVYQVVARETFEEGKRPVFQAHSDRANTWNIVLSEQVLAVLRAELPIPRGDGGKQPSRASLVTGLARDQR
ncbi:MAG: hypothetical protein ACYSWU_26180 [Planctomycetota bacterium]